MDKYDEHTELQYIKGKVKIEWVNLNEGFSGDYDPSDEQLLRFDVSRLDRFDCWVEVSDASYCTLFPVLASAEDKKEGLQVLMDNVYEQVCDGHGIKRLCQRLSWISPETMESF